MSDRHLSVLRHLLANAGSIASKDALIAAAWNDVAGRGLGAHTG